MSTEADARDRIVVVGASVAGLAACEELRAGGFDGAITLIGAESHAPYDRPPLSKQILLETMDVDDILLREQAELDALELDIRLGQAATALDVASQTVTLRDGSRVSGRAVVVATGSQPIRLSGQPLDAPFFELRTLDDAIRMRAAIAGAERLVIVGAGFIGLEVAAVARSRGCEVTVLEAAEHPLARVLAPEVVAPLTELHRERGVEIRCDVQVVGFGHADSGEALIILADGSTLQADAALVGIGAAPAVSWLAESGLDVAGGVQCDGGLRAAPGVWAIGDVARWEHPLFGDIRVEHWSTTRDHARVMAQNVLATLRGEAGSAVASAIPYFWSDQYEVKLQMAGWPIGADEVESEVDEHRRVYRFRRDGKPVAALCWNWARQIALERRAIERQEIAQG